MTIKVVISGEGGAGKTTLIQDLKDALLISHDGKKPLVNIPSNYVRTFDNIEEFIDITVKTVEMYKSKYDTYPTTVVFDSVSRIYDTINSYCDQRYSGYAAYTNMDKEIKKLNDFIEDELIANGIEVIQIAHAIYDNETSKYKLVGKGSYAKLGGAYSTVEEAIFIETRANKRIVHLRATKFPARSKQDSLPDSVSVADFNMQEYLDTIRASQSKVDELSLCPQENK